MMMESVFFLAIGLAILIYEAHRQFNEPSYARPIGDEAELIYVLSPSEIRSRSAFFSAELVYISIIVAIYLLFLYNGAFQRVAEFVLGFISATIEAGGAVPDQGSGGGAAQAVQDSGVRSDPNSIERAAAPFVVAVTLVTALRLPFVRRLEVMLRSFAQRLFGIPRIPDRLRQKIEDTPVDLEAIERALPADHRGIRYGERIARFVTAAEDALPASTDIHEFRKNLAKVAAFQIWVRDLKIWPSAEFRNDFELFRTRNNPLLDDISALIKDLDLLSNPAVVGRDDGAGSADEDREIAAGRKGMQRELWELKIKQAAALARRVSALMALYDQNSNLPDEDKPTAASLRKFLAAARSDDEARTFQINLAIILIVLTVITNGVAGFVYAGRLEALAISFGVAQPGGPYNPQFDGALTAGLFVVSALIVYGLSIWIALDYRSRSLRRGAWPNFFGSEGGTPPLTQLTPVMALVLVAVFVANFVLAYGQSVQWTFTGTQDALWESNVVKQAHLSLIFALVGAVHGTAIAMMMDLRRKQFENHVWIVVILGYVAAMAGMGYLVGHYLGSERFLGAPATPNVAAMRPAAQNMRELLYAFDLALIAFLSSLALTSFIRPRPLRTDAAAPELALDPRP